MQSIYLNRLEQIIQSSPFGKDSKGDSGHHLVSIFHGLGGSQKSKKKFFPKHPLTIEKPFFPTETPIDDLENLKTVFQKEYENLPTNTLSRAESLLCLLQIFAVGLPAGDGEDGTSLYDYAKMEAALAVCRYENPNEKFLLIGGALSGIQSYLYDIVSSRASKNLKGRSFYLHLLADSALTLLLEKTGLFRCNVITASGGAFFIIAPDTVAVRNAFEEWRYLVLDELFEKHHGDLFFETGFVETVVSALDEKAVWDEINKIMSSSRNGRFAKQILNRFDDIFDPEANINFEGLEARDALTGDAIEGTGWDLEELFTWDGVELTELELRAIESPVSKITKLQTELGQVLKRADFWITSPQEYLVWNGVTNDDDIYETEIFGIRQYFIAANNWNRARLNEKCLVRAMGPTLHFPTSTNEFVRSFELYGGNNFPEIELENIETGEKRYMPKTFSELTGSFDEDRIQKRPIAAGERKRRRWQYLQKEPWEEPAFKRLAILRMDVDGLGCVFKNENLKLSQRIALSRQLDWFFKGHLNNIWDDETHFIERKISKNGQETIKKDLFREYTQIIYSGGDDLFLVGRWDCLLAFAQKIRERFTAFVCENDHLGISGGIVFVTHKFPVIKAAEFCDIAERKAKSHQANGIFKNAMTLFGHPLNWELEFLEVRKMKEKLLENIKQNKLPRGILTRIHSFSEARVSQRENGLPESWRWQLAYDFTRIRERIEKKHKETADLLEDWQKSAITGSVNTNSRKSNYDFIELLRVAARWAEIEERAERLKSNGLQVNQL